MPNEIGRETWSLEIDRAKYGISPVEKYLVAEVHQRTTLEINAVVAWGAVVSSYLPRSGALGVEEALRLAS